jgi:hypothetical protein
MFLFLQMQGVTTRTGSSIPIAYKPTILRAVMFAAFMAKLFCSIARRENRRIASYVTVFATAGYGTKERARKPQKCGRAKYIHFAKPMYCSPGVPDNSLGEINVITFLFLS